MRRIDTVNGAPKTSAFIKKDNDRLLIGERGKLFGSVSLAGLIAAAAWTMPALAIDMDGAQTKIVDSTQAAAGANADAGRIFSDGKPSSKGETGRVLDYRLFGTAGDAETPGNYIYLLSAGGRGGDGVEGYHGSDGGAGGNISFEQSGTVLVPERGMDTLTPLIWLQSIGGVGGKGAHRTTNSGWSAYDIVYNAGAGGAGGEVSANVLKSVGTQGDLYTVIRATSQGGTGGEYGAGKNDPFNSKYGQGGSAAPVSVAIGGEATVFTTGKSAPAIIAEALGGTGGLPMNTGEVRGGDGGDVGGTLDRPSVDFTNRGKIETIGNNSAAVVLQSIGGTGRDGPSGGRGLSGGGGGTGGVVTGDNTGTINTMGDYAFGIVAQSVGGSGGEGGEGFTRGGNGGAAGRGGVVAIINKGRVQTEGEGATGIAAQSVGGGNALAALPTGSTAGTAGGGSGGGAFFGSGGKGGSGGDAGSVTVTNSGAIETWGDSANGILAQSIGGGGGDGGAVKGGGLFIAVALGGAGAGGGHGGTVTLNSADNRSGSTITTWGDNAIAVLAQSIGGSGGIGGSAWTASLGYKGSLSVAIGGSGGKGGDGGIVDIANTSVLTTAGAGSAGIQAMSIGGGGGVGGKASSYAVSLSEDTAVSVPVSVGGSGGDGGKGGEVKVRNLANINTYDADAVGIEAMSIGGGGGIAGNAISYALAASTGNAVSLPVTVGGSGGGGGVGGNVSVTNSAAILTAGTVATGISAVSIGGGGGKAGGGSSTANMLGLIRNIGANFVYGGSGGGGGHGGNIDVLNSGSIKTTGQFAQGVAAASVGGGGGVGGTADMSAATEFSPDLDMGSEVKTGVKALSTYVEMLGFADAFTASIALGGRGGDGGNGGAIRITNSGTILTQGSNATAVSAASVGGGGGVGGGFQGAGEGDMAGNLTIGGAGGKGGVGGTVTVKNEASASIQTDEAGSFGVFAQSVGGGGGTGGAFSGKRKSAPSIPFANGEGTSFNEILSASVAMGNELLSLNKAGSKFLPDSLAPDKKSSTQQSLTDLKSILKAAKVAADEDKSVAERITGSAVFGGLAALQIKNREKIKAFSDRIKSGSDWKVWNVSTQVAVGGTGGGGGAGGKVTITNDGAIKTAGETAYAVFAQSVGGGGGVGGGAYASAKSLINANVSLGGSGGEGGNGGAVAITNTGSISTSGTGSFGLFAQSVGGGGGVAGASSNASGMSIANLNINVGKSGGGSGNGGDIQVINSGAIHTQGVEAHALVAQSIGGGGGVFYANPGDADNKGTVLTQDEAEVVELSVDLMKSLGMMQGEEVGFDNSTTILPKPALNVSFGGSGSSGGHAGEVTVTNEGVISTSGVGSFGIFAQSIGGGGGFGTTAGGSGWLQGNFAFGGTGGSAGNGGRIGVTLANGSSVTTSGDAASAIFLQSIGGGGGYGGVGRSIFGVPSVNDSGSSGDGGDIRLEMNAKNSRMTLKTTGAYAHGIFAQSLGGGGGTMARTDGYAQSASTQAITNEHSGRTHTTGGSGRIFIDIAGTIQATGEGSHGIYVQSGLQKADATLDASKGGNEVAITYSGMLTGGTGTGAGIVIDGGSRNILTIAAESTVQALSGHAILATFGSETVINRGTVIGNVDLAQTGIGDENQFTNHVGATLQSAETINLGTRGLFVNDGRLNIGGTGRIVTTKLTGDFDMFGDSTLLVDVSSEAGTRQSSDLLEISGKARLNGGILQPMVGKALLPGSYTVLTANNGINGQLRTDSEPNRAVPINWEQTNTNQQIAVSPQVDFRKPVGITLSEDQSAVAENVQSIWNAKTTQLAELFPYLLAIETGADYAEALDELTPDENQNALNQIQDARAGLKAALSCPAFTGTGTMLREGECFWGRVEANQATMSSSAEQDGYNMHKLTYRVGGQKELAPDWLLGFSAAYSHGSSQENGGMSNSRRQSMEGSVAIKRQIGPWQFAASATIGNTWVDNIRFSSVGGLNAALESNATVFFSGLRVRGSYEFAMQDWYIKPYIDLDALYFNFGSYSEKGASLLALNVAGTDQTIFSVSPRVEIGGRMNFEKGDWLRPYGTIGFTWLSESELTTRSSLQVAPAGLPEFESSSTIPDKLLNIGLGAQYSNGNGIDLTVEYNADIAKNYLEHTGVAKLSVRF